MEKRARQDQPSTMPLPGEQLLPHLRQFAEQLTAKFTAPSAGEPEDQLRAPVEQLFAAYGRIICRDLVLKGESALAGRLGRPDFAAHAGNLLIGYFELKAPGKGTNPQSFKGHDREQWERFQNVPNVIYTDGNEWALYRSGELEGRRVRLKGDAQTEGQAAVTAANAKELFQLLADFSSWTPLVPAKPQELAAFLAPYCRLLREEVLDALRDATSPLQRLKEEIKKLLFPEATDWQFADAYAQTTLFALLLARLEGADVLDLDHAYQTLASRHLLLSRTLEFLTRDQPREEIQASLSLVQRVLREVQPEAFAAEERRSPESAESHPWLFFYEHFLAKYDPALRKAWGVYYTPAEVVRCQVRLIDEILTKHLGRPMGFLEAGVITLDPALGTGTYLLAVIEHALERVKREEGPGAVKSSARLLMQNLYGFEWMVGPYAVAQLRLSRALTACGITLPPGGIGIYLTNTLESPHVKPPTSSVFHQPIADEHERALRVKDMKPVLVCLGNPPYGRHEAAETGNKAVTGGWVRYGGLDGERAILEDFLEPARQAGHGVHLKNLYNLYVYFTRWALWKVFEHTSAPGIGIVSFITCSSYLDGEAFAGLREHLRRLCDQVDIIDLGGEGRGPRQDENVFAIRTPVAIFVAWRGEEKKKKKDAPATVRYTRIEGTREEKLAALDRVKSQRHLQWRECPSEWQAPFRPAAKGAFGTWPLLTDLFSWQQSGAEIKRSWPIGPETDVLRHRWETLVSSDNKAELFKETRDRKVNVSYPDLRGPEALPPLEEAGVPDMAEPVPYAFRSFDRQWVIPDNRVGDYFRPVLWLTHSKRQTYLTSRLTQVLGKGPALMVCAAIPDRHHFAPGGAKDIIPLYRDAAAKEPNILPCLLETLAKKYKKEVSPEDLAGYVYALLAQPEYTARFARELTSRRVRVPLTENARLFFQAAEFGKKLIWLHTYGERLAGRGRQKGSVPKGKAKCLKAVSDREEEYPNEFHYEETAKTLHVGDGRFGPVEPAVFEFEVSGLKVVKSWLGYRMWKRSGRKSSPLDEIRPRTWTHQFTRELLELLWVLERTVAGYAEQKKLLAAVLSGELFRADELPPVPAAARQAPKTKRTNRSTQEHWDF